MQVLKKINQKVIEGVFGCQAWVARAWLGYEIILIVKLFHVMLIHYSYLGLKKLEIYQILFDSSFVQSDEMDKAFLYLEYLQLQCADFDRIIITSV